MQVDRGGRVHQLSHSHNAPEVALLADVALGELPPLTFHEVVPVGSDERVVGIAIVGQRVGVARVHVAG